MTLNQGPWKYLSQATLRGDPHRLPTTSPPRTVTCQGTQSADQRTYRGTTAKGLAELAGIPIDAVDSMDVTRPGAGDRIHIEKPQLLDGYDNDHEAFFDPEYTGDVTSFARPQADANDINARDCIAAPDDDALDVDFTTSGPVLAVSVGADRTNPAPNTDVTFTASASPAGPNVTYTWDFDDDAGDSEPTGAKVTHRFTVDGLRSVKVTAYDPANDATGLGTQAIQVGPVDPGGTATTPVPAAGAAPAGSGGNGGGAGRAATGSGKGGRTGGNTGPRRGSGKDASGTVPRDSGAASDGAVTKTKPRGRTTKSSTSSAAQPAPAAGTPAPATAASSAATRGGADGPAAGGAPAAPSTTRPQGRAAARRLSGRPGAARVSGVLVADSRDDLSAALAAADALAREPETGERAAARSAAGHGWAPLGWVAGGAGLVGLLALGAAGEALRANHRLLGPRSA